MMMVIQGRLVLQWYLTIGRVKTAKDFYTIVAVVVGIHMDVECIKKDLGTNTYNKNYKVRGRLSIK